MEAALDFMSVSLVPVFDTAFVSAGCRRPTKKNKIRAQHDDATKKFLMHCFIPTTSIDPLPMAHLNDSDLWSHSLQITSERELPSKDEMEFLLNLYFRFMYPFAPMFIRKVFMEEHRRERPDLPRILILNAIFCNACWYSDDPLIKQESTKFFNRAKIILDETYHVSRISTVQALLLMSHHQYATGNYSGGWLYTGMAQRIALVRKPFLTHVLPQTLVLSFLTFNC